MQELSLAIQGNFRKVIKTHPNKFYEGLPYSKIPQTRNQPKAQNRQTKNSIISQDQSSIDEKQQQEILYGLRELPNKFLILELLLLWVVLCFYQLEAGVMCYFLILIDYNLNMRDHREQIKEIKEGVINKKLESKPSFKNLFDLQKEKVPAKDRSPRGTNKSRSISQKKGPSQQKIGTVPIKKNRQSRLSQLSARKSETSINMNRQQLSQMQNRQKKAATEISQISQNNSQQENDRRYQTENLSNQLHQESKISQYRYTEKNEHSPKGSKSRSARKASSRNKGNFQQQIFKMIINMKNDINRLEKVIQSQEREIRKKMGRVEGNQERKTPKSRTNRRMVDWQTLQKLKTKKSFLSEYSEQIISQTDEIGRSYLTKLAQLGNQQQFQQQNCKLPNTTSLLLNSSPGMPQLEKKLKSVSRLLI